MPRLLNINFLPTATRYYSSYLKFISNVAFNVLREKIDDATIKKPQITGPDPKGDRGRPFILPSVPGPSGITANEAELPLDDIPVETPRATLWT